MDPVLRYLDNETMRENACYENYYRESFAVQCRHHLPLLLALTIIHGNRNARESSLSDSIGWALPLLSHLIEESSSFQFLFRPDRADLGTDERERGTPLLFHRSWLANNDESRPLLNELTGA